MIRRTLLPQDSTQSMLGHQSILIQRLESHSAQCQASGAMEVVYLSGTCCSCVVFTYSPARNTFIFENLFGAKGERYYGAAVTHEKMPCYKSLSLSLFHFVIQTVPITIGIEIYKIYTTTHWISQ